MPSAFSNEPGPTVATPSPPGAGPNERDAGWSAALLAVALIALAGDVFLSSPRRFDSRPWPAGSLLKPIVEALSLYARAPTPRDVEVRSLAFGIGAAALMLIGGAWLAAQRTKRGPAISAELDADALARGPMAWWGLLILASLLSSAFSHAPRIATGGVVLRLMCFAWWWPIAAVLTPRHAQRLVLGLTLMLAAVAGLAIWYQFVRAADPSGRLRYPFGNEGWEAACLLPGLVVAVAWGVFGKTGAGGSRWASRGLAIAAAIPLAYATVLTRSRSAAVGLLVAFWTMGYLSCGRRGRRLLLAGSLVIAAGGLLSLEFVRATGTTAWRAESIRSRVEHEWPYALRLWRAKFILGHGESGYTMLAGQFARDEQFEEPAVTAITANDYSIWSSHAHNEYLELLVDLGLIGAISFAAAIVVTLRRASIWATTGSDRARRAIVLGLAGALAGSAAECAFGVALRSPGLPPILLTIWGSLWALVRGLEEPAGAEDRPAAASTRWRERGVGAAAAIGGIVLGYLAWADWLASRRAYEAETALAAGNALASADLAEFAAKHQLDPFRRLLNELTTVRARTSLFAQRLLASTGPPSDADLRIGQDALARLERLRLASPRFLLTAQLDAGTSRALMTAYERRRQPSEWRHYRQRMLSALAQQCRDEPFDVHAVERLWRATPDVPIVDRLRQLRGVMRFGIVDETWQALFRGALAQPQFRATFNDLFEVAGTDSRQPPSEWADALSPETYRLAARIHDADGNAFEAEQAARTAAEMYAAAGPRLSGGRAAALLEAAAYRLAMDPFAATEILSTVDEADRLRGGEAASLSDVGRRLRWMVSLADDRDVEVGAEALSLARKTGCSPVQAQQAVAGCLGALARQFVGRKDCVPAEVTLSWAMKATELSPEDPQLQLAAAEAALVVGDMALLGHALNRFLALAPEPELAAQELIRLERKYPGRIRVTESAPERE